MLRSSVRVKDRYSGWHIVGAAASLLSLLLGLVLCSEGASAPRVNLNGHYTATAYSTAGITKSGEYTHRHIIAADPDVLPIGTRIRVRWAGKYSGEYLVADTGRKITGRRLDIFLPSTPECKKFGRKSVRVKVLQMGDGTHESAKVADQVVKNDVAHDIAQGTVGHAATETDWNQKGGATKAAIVAASKTTAEGATATTKQSAENAASNSTSDAASGTAKTVSDPTGSSTQSASDDAAAKPAGNNPH